ncbi:MAG: GNAT family N-acetyltransferase, partial [Geminicoccales bacterium]
MLSAGELMELHVETLFLHDDAGRMLAVNDVDRRAAPQLFLGRTVEGNIWRFRHDLSPELVAELEAILADEPLADDLEQPAVTAGRLRQALSRDAPVESIWQGPAWHFPERITLSSDVQPHRVTPEMEFTGDRFTWLADELDVSQPCFVVLDGTRIASLCHSSRNAPAAAEAGVETLAAYRRRGYAAAVTAAWA